MKINYEEPVLYISMFDDEDDILTASIAKNSIDQAEDAINKFAEGSVSIYSVDVNEK